MAEKLIISISGMRGLVGVNLTADIAADYGRAFGTFLKSTYPVNPGICSPPLLLAGFALSALM